MNFSVSNIFNFPLICFLFGVFLSLIRGRFVLPAKLTQFLTVYILFCIGLKGGSPLAQLGGSSLSLFFMILGALILWGLLSPLLSFFLVRSFTRIDTATAAAIGASFGSVSVMTFVAAISFLEQMQVGYEKIIIAALAIMEIPAIISGVFIAKSYDGSAPPSIGKLLHESLFNKAILSIVFGLIVGMVLSVFGFGQATDTILLSFKPLLSFFLFGMGLYVGLQREQFRSFSWPLNLFGIYMPLIGAAFGLILSYVLGLDVGTGTLIAVLAASSSYIAVPAAMRIALPEAREAIYLPLSLGIAFPFNVIIGIPIYYWAASRSLI